jgi:hypothetical protein
VSSDVDIREWLDDDVTRRQLDRLRVEIGAATKDVLLAAQTKAVEEVRARDGYRRGLIRAWTVLGGRTPSDAEETEA